jgi:peptidoglycan hydrolase-like protein with peptidoglycan-binding domain
MIRTKVPACLALVALVVSMSACDSGDDDVATTEGTTATQRTEATEPAATTTEAAPEATPPTLEQDDPVAAAEAQVAAAEEGVTAAQDDLTAANEQFCADAEGYVDALDRYGKLFTDDEATVGDVQTGGADLVEPQETVQTAVDSVFEARDALAAAQQELVDAQAALAEAIATASSLPTSSTTPGTTTTTTLVPPATVERVQQAEDDLAQVAEGITPATPLSEATAEFNSAAFALQIAWMRLLFDAGCLSDRQQAQAVEQVTAYTIALQTDLQRAGYLDGPIDGIYGPQTADAVKRLQADSGLRETGFVDRATAEALNQKLEELGLQETKAQMTHTAAVQTILKLTGFWDAPIDGVWTDELTAALQAFQTSLGVTPTGQVDAATLAAFEQAIADLIAAASATTVPATTAPPATEPPPTEPPATEPTEVSTSAPSTTEA